MGGSLVRRQQAFGAFVGVVPDMTHALDVKLVAATIACSQDDFFFLVIESLDWHC